MISLRPVSFAVLIFLVAFVGTELVLQLAEHGWIGTLRWRMLAYQNGAFWPGLLRDWLPNYSAQPITMFVSYTFLHSGLSHMAGNAGALIFLGPYVCARVGQNGFGGVCLASAVGGGLAFALLHQTPQPMIGASGVIFGLAGALTALVKDKNRAHASSRIAVIIGLLIVLNGMVWYALDGILAWETHLGGFIAGFALAFILPERR